jgi:hypothetical protein
MAADWSHQPRRAYSFAYRLAKRRMHAQISPTDIRGACQFSEEREYHCGVSHIYRCRNRHTIGQHAHQQRDLQFESFFASNSSRKCGANCFMSLGSNMFAAGFADTELRRTIMSGMMGRSLAEDLAVVNNTLTTWSPRSVRMIAASFSS